MATDWTDPRTGRRWRVVAARDPLAIPLMVFRDASRSAGPSPEERRCVRWAAQEPSCMDDAEIMELFDEARSA